LVNLGVARDALAQRSLLPKGRLPFQVQDVGIVLNGHQEGTLFTVPGSKRLEIHNVTAVLNDFASETFPQVLLAECDAVSPTTDHAKDGSLPLIMALRTLSSSDPQRGVFFGAAQPTLLHAFPGYLVTCEITLLPPSGAAYVKWTISGFLDDPD
jgi:hypothetical protein